MRDTLHVVKLTTDKMLFKLQSAYFEEERTT